MQIHVSRSTGIFDPQTWANIEDATVILENYGAFSYDGDGYYTINKVPSPDTLYKIRVEVAGFPTLLSEDSLPAVTVIDTAVFRDSSIIGADGEIYSEIDLVLSDTAGRKDYYEVSVFQIDTTTGEQVPICFESQSVVIENNVLFVETNPCYDIALFSDQLFDGGPIILNTRFLRSIQGEPVYIQLRSCSFDYYQYQLTYYNFKKLLGNPFSDPVPVHDNVQNGLGIFAGFRSDTYALN